jgi:hypothetical protein
VGKHRTSNIEFEDEDEKEGKRSTSNPSFARKLRRAGIQQSTFNIEFEDEDEDEKEGKRSTSNGHIRVHLCSSVVKMGLAERAPPKAAFNMEWRPEVTSGCRW